MEINRAVIYFLCNWLMLPLHTLGGSSSNGLKWVRVNVPQYRIPGETALLQCNYDIGNDTLYAVKWYKEHQEFYRYLPKDKPPASSFEVEGIHVDLPQSNSTKVVLRSVDFKTSGLFQCEVSAEAPSFASAQSEARMEVVSLPKEDPTITGVEMQYQIGDQINLNCTSGKSQPASILNWYINEQQVDRPGALIHYSPVSHHHGLVSTTLGLQFQLSHRHFLGGSMRVKCVASVSPVLWKGDRESVVKSLPSKDMREALLLGEWSQYSYYLQSTVHVKSSASKVYIFSSLLVLIGLVYCLT